MEGGPRCRNILGQFFRFVYLLIHLHIHLYHYCVKVTNICITKMQLMTLLCNNYRDMSV